MEIFAEFVLEFILSAYAEILVAVVPEKKLKNWQKQLLQVLCIIVFLGAIAMFVAGLATYMDGNRTYAPVLIGVGAGLTGLQAVLSFVAFGLRLKRKAREDAESRDAPENKNTEE